MKHLDFNATFFTPFNVDEARASLLNRFKKASNQLDYQPIINDDIMILIDCVLEYLKEEQERINQICLKNYLRFSEGEFLEQMCALIGIERKSAVPPQGLVSFSANTPTFLAKGTALSDGRGHLAFLLKDTYVVQEATAPFEAELSTPEDAQFNLLVVPNIYIDKIEQKDSLIYKNYVESDEELKERFKLALHQFSTAGSKAAYKFHTLSVAGVEKCEIYDDKNRPGEVDIIYQSDLNNAETKIIEALEPHRPLTDKINLIRSKNLDQTLRILIKVKDLHLLSENISTIDAEIRAHYARASIGQFIEESKIISLCKNANVYHIEVASELLQPAKNEILRLISLSIELAQ